MLSLYISDQKIDLPEKFSILFSHTLEDRTNPTVVKNSFSKTIELPGTDNNNKVFGTFFRNDRWQMYGERDWGACFDPSKRVPFTIYENGDLIQNGYCKLDKVKRTNEQVLYYVSLYGGLGEFFYNLTYTSDGVEKKLSDLDFGMDLGFKINKDTIQSAWDALDSSNDSKWQIINFAPAYNGIPEDFDSQKVLINTAGSSLFTTTATDEGKTYTTRNGYMVGELDKSYDEWQIRDLRSYLQRPVIRVKSLLQACFDPKNNSGDTNSGYTVDLDSDFFNPDNPYYEDAWISLPLLNNTDKDEEITVNPSRTSFVATTTTSGVTGTTALRIEGGDVVSDLQNTVDLSSYPFSYVNVSAKVGLSVNALPNRTDGLMSKKETWEEWLVFWKTRVAYGAVFAQLLAYDADTNNLLGGSDILAFLPNNYVNYEVNAQDFIGNGAGKYTPLFNANYIEVRGGFSFQNDFKFRQSANGSLNWNISIEKCPKANRMKFVLRFNKAWCAKGDGLSKSGWDSMSTGITQWDAVYNRSINCNSTGYGSLSLTLPGSLSSDALISQEKLLSTEYTPADYLLAYSKMFGLYWFKDRYENKIYCRTRNNFFYPVVEDINDLIDRSQAIETTPFIFDHKWYSMTQETPESYFGDKYQKDWGRVYGDQRINTNYNFDSECEEMFEGIPYQNAILARASSSYFADYQNKQGLFVPAFFLDGWKGKLFNGTDEYEMDYSPNLVDWSRMSPWYAVPSFDFLPKVCYYQMDNNERKPVDINNVLLFYNGKATLPEHFWITDDNGYMVSLNDEVCWLYTERSTDEEGNIIALRADSIPSFSRYKTAGGTILRSFDFGDPKELYVDNITLGANSSIYNRYWKDYLSDQFNVNARVVTCYVLWDREVNEELQRRFWYFDNSIWVLNRIIDYDLNGYKPVKCEFIKIIDTGNYTKSQIIASSRPNDGTSYDDPGYPQPHIVPSSADPNNGYDGDGDGCQVIVFQDPLTEAYAVQAWDKNGDGKLDVCEAAAVTSLGTVFKGTGIESFDEIVYFTGINGIEAGAFSGCTNLDHIILPGNIDYIRSDAFEDCTDMNYIQVESTDPPVLGTGAFDNTNDCPIKINCDYLDDFRTQWSQYASRLECASGGGDLVLATSITINVTDITDSGRATYTLEPSNADNYAISWSSSNSNIATIDSNGDITVLQNGTVTICVYENVAGLVDCQTINVTKTPPSYGWIEVSPVSKTVEYTSGDTTFNITTQNIV